METEQQHIEIDAWAPCSHTADERAEMWANYIPKDGVSGLSFELNDMGAHPIKIFSDQWFGIDAEGEIDGVKITARVQSDYVEAGIVKLHEEWKKVWEQIKGEEYVF